MIEKEYMGLKISLPKESVKEIWGESTPVFQDLVTAYFWKNKGSMETKKHYNYFINKTGIQYSGDLNLDEYKKSGLYDRGYVEWFFLEYPEHKRFSTEYRNELKKLLYNNNHPQVLSYKNDWYLGLKNHLNSIKRKEITI